MRSCAYFVLKVGIPENVSMDADTDSNSVGILSLSLNLLYDETFCTPSLRLIPHCKATVSFVIIDFRVLAWPKS